MIAFMHSWDAPDIPAWLAIVIYVGIHWLIIWWALRDRN